MPIDPAEVNRLLEAAAEADTAAKNGAIYEELAEYLFDQVPGCIAERDLISPLRTEQIDIAVGNSLNPNGLQLLPKVFLVECKDWDRPVDSTTVGYFINILANRGVELGILIAAKGITGSPEGFTYAHALGVSAAPRGIKVLVIATAEIATIRTTGRVRRAVDPPVPEGGGLRRSRVP